MITVGAFEAKTTLSALLDRVASGEDVLITKHGKPVARLTKPLPADEPDVDAVIERLRDLRRGVTLGDLDWRELRDEGRK
ncbi:MAG: type II toxin-antitoxin system prevent-host-death family antitoxin [Alphaproteobacteria bacterium]|nr:type II toxin-antitoxin system prevent-host-death family antitoxin [Alphaproteobacteria bacterium]